MALDVLDSNGLNWTGLDSVARCGLLFFLLVVGSITLGLV
jgi:hypothetical protein